MRILNYIAFIILFIGINTLASGQRFSCNGQILIASFDGQSTTIYRPVYIPFNPPFLSPLVRYPNVYIDAIGFNSVDNYLYGIKQNTREVVRLKRDNTFDILGPVGAGSSLNALSGDCTVDGQFVVYDNDADQLLFFDVVNNFDLLRSINLFWDPSSGIDEPFTTSIFDLAVDPNNPNIAYTYQGNHFHPELEPESTKGQLLKINIDLNSPNLGMVSPAARVNSNIVSHLGGLLFSPEGTINAIGTSQPGFNPAQHLWYSINPITGQAFVVLGTPRSLNSDGCSCPFAFTFECEAPGEGIVCNNDEKSFYFTIENYSFDQINDVVLRDTFPEGLIVSSVSSDFPEAVLMIDGIGTNILEITNLDIAPKTNYRINVRVRSVDAEVGPTDNQGFLSNLPERFDGPLPSDQPGASGVEGDPSFFIVFPPRLEDASWEAEGPTDCLDANDGFIAIQSMAFESGLTYEVKMRNEQDWNEFQFDIQANASNTIVIDSLMPGDYQIYQIRSQSDDCGVSLKDTSILLEPPNDLIQLSMTTNSPICEGDDLYINTTVSPTSLITWKGPGVLGLESSEVFIASARSEKSGLYEAVATYGFCEKLDSLDIVVHPPINARIRGNSVYCEGSPLNLTAEGRGEDLIHNWSTNNGAQFNRETLSIDSITFDQAGIVELISDNGACLDTFQLNIEILTAPHISMSSVFTTDFCDNTILQPQLNGLQNPTFDWWPAEGLSCTDCPSPELVPQVEEVYNLVVINDNDCTDSLELTIELDRQRTAYVPNVFDLSAIGVNSEFNLYPGCIVEAVRQFDIYDAWGNLVHSTNNLNGPMEAWKGYANGFSLNKGVYVWTAELELVDGTIENLSGSLTLLK